MDVSVTDRLTLLLHYAKDGYVMGYCKHNNDYEVYINIDVDDQTITFRYAGYELILPIEGLVVKMFSNESVMLCNYSTEISMTIPRTVLELVV